MLITALGGSLQGELGIGLILLILETEKRKKGDAAALGISALSIWAEHLGSEILFIVVRSMS